MKSEIFNTPFDQGRVRSMDLDTILGFLRGIRPQLASNPFLRDSLSSSVLEYLGRKYPDVRSDLVEMKGGQELSTPELIESGFLDLGVLIAGADVSDILSNLEEFSFDFELPNLEIIGRAPLREAGKFPHASIAHLSKSDIGRIDKLTRVILSDRVQSAISEYFNGFAIVNSINLWVSFPRNSVSELSVAEHFHRDKDCFRFLKLFVYLSDVDEESGPHQYVLGSHRIDKLSEILGVDKKSLGGLFQGSQRDNSRIWSGLIDSGKVNTVMPVGKAGSAFVEDTYGVHRGIMPISRRRVLFQVLFTLIPWERVMYDEMRHVARPLFGDPKYCSPYYDYQFQSFANG